MEEFQNITDLENICNAYQANNILLVCGKTSFQKSGAKEKLQSFLGTKSITYFSDFTENPKLEDAIKGADLLKNNKVELILAIGGGSTIDIAKLIKILSVFPKAGIELLNTPTAHLSLDLPLIVAPTTAGTGSEATHFAVVYYQGNKYSVAHKDLLPNKIILDASLTESMPSYLTACSGLDALCQSVESYWSVNSTIESIAYAKEAIGLILENLPIAVHKPTKKVREKMLKASFLAGKAINITKTTAPHALSYTLTSKYGIKHGHAVALFLPVFFKFNAQVGKEDCNDKRGAMFVKERFVELTTLIGSSSVDDASIKLLEFISSLDINTKLSDFNLNKTHIVDIVENINFQRLKNNPRKVTTQNLKAIVESTL